MVTILLDSSDKLLAIGVAEEGKLIGYTQYEAWQRQSEMMVSELDKLLSLHHIDKSKIAKVICGRGPGSYTGVRIALTIAKVMALTLNIPLVLVSSLHILKCDDLPSICVINARSGRSYIGVYHNEKVILEDQIMKNDEVRAYINAHQDFIICGDVSHLKLQGKNVNVLSQMASLEKYLTPEKDHLGVTPTYMKD